MTALYQDLLESEVRKLRAYPASIQAQLEVRSLFLSWYCRIWIDADDSCGNIVDAYADTPSLAIVLAALKSKGIAVD